MDKIIYNRILINKKLKSFVDRLVVNINNDIIDNIIELDENDEFLKVYWVNKPSNLDENNINKLWKGKINHSYDGLFYVF